MNTKSANTESLPIAWREYCKIYGSLDAKRIDGIGLGMGITFTAVWAFFSLFFGVRHRLTPKTFFADIPFRLP